MGARVKHAIGALFGCVLGFGASVTLQNTAGPSTASAPSPAGMVMGITFSKAHADSKRRKRTRARKAAARKAEEKRLEEADKKLEGIRRATLPANCVKDFNASATYATETYLCGGMYYQRYEENGVTGFEGHAVGLDRGAIKRAQARRAEARRAKAKMKLQVTRRADLPANCVYDTYVSAATNSDVYAGGGVRYRQYQEKGVTGYEVVKP